MTDKQIKILEMMGFKEIVTDYVLAELEIKTTKTAQNVLKRLNSVMSNCEFFIYTSDDKFTIKSSYLVTKEEINQIKQILNKDYIRLSTALDQNNLWIKWINEEK